MIADELVANYTNGSPLNCLFNDYILQTIDYNKDYNKSFDECKIPINDEKNKNSEIQVTCFAISLSEMELSSVSWSSEGIEMPNSQMKKLFQLGKD